MRKRDLGQAVRNENQRCSKQCCSDAELHSCRSAKGCMKRGAAPAAAEKHANGQETPRCPPSSSSSIRSVSPLTLYYGGLIVFVKETEVDMGGRRGAWFPTSDKLFISFVWSSVEVFAFPLSNVFLIRSSCQHTSAGKVTRRVTKRWSMRCCGVFIAVVPSFNNNTL